ncbi:MAG: heavy metal translocating P-type ATPase [Gammaproteobacteria bacterium]|nr:heavy metal translocating P-type ATPase [Gammaproteobacteria bacterium]
MSSVIIECDGSLSRCFHCGQPMPGGARLEAVVGGSARPMCCHGCKAAAETIVACGLDRFYRMRTGEAPRPDEQPAVLPARFAAFDDPVLQQRFVVRLPDGDSEATLLLDGIACAACCWLIEQRLAGLDGLKDARVNYAAHTAAVRWDPARLAFSGILAAVAQLGYHAAPYDAGAAELQLSRERGVQLRRIGIAGLFGMQIMVLSLALYLGADAGVDPGLAPLFRWSAGVLVLPILLYSAVPFFRGAARGLRAHTFGMDVPVALGIAIAFLGSIHSLLTGTGHVYFDSIAMFVFILLCGRFVEFSVRRRAAAQWDRLQRIQPATATRLRADPGGGHSEEVVPVTVLEIGDQVRVRPGETIPVDGKVTAGDSSVNEALLTGESLPARRGPGDAVIGGSVNVESPLCIQVSRIGAESRLAQIARLARDAESTRPEGGTFADRVAARFIGRLLLIALGVALFWWFRDPERWIPITISVLVITCPCALALAAPAALAAATGTLLRLGLLVRRAHAVESLGRAMLFVFDKTGTLTTGELQVVAVRVPQGGDAAAGLAAAAALEAGSEHPVGRAIRAVQRGSVAPAGAIRTVAGEGVAGTVAGCEHFLGTPAFVARMTDGRVNVAAPAAREEEGPVTRVVLATRAALLAEILLSDSLREGARELVRYLSTHGHGVRLFSGDGGGAVAAIAAQAGITHAEGGLLPARKLERLNQLRTTGQVICMTGDGVNDAPVLAAADVSVAVGGGADLAQASADIVMLGGRLDALRAGIDVARRTLRIMRQNVGWAIAYNVIAVPLAATGQVTPWMAALGMSLSSLLVVMNASRLVRA